MDLTLHRFLVGHGSDTAPLLWWAVDAVSNYSLFLRVTVVILNRDSNGWSM